MLSVQNQVEVLLSQMTERSKHDPVIERLSEQVSVLCRGYLCPSPDEQIEDFEFSKMEARFFNHLLSRLGKTVLKSSLMDSMYFDYTKEEPMPKILDVFAFRIRAKIKHSKYDLQTIHWVGYRLVCRDTQSDTA
jgi:DNA-binding response OmpR family regulator